MMPIQLSLPAIMQRQISNLIGLWPHKDLGHCDQGPYAVVSGLKDEF